MARGKIQIDKNKYLNSLVRKSELFMSDLTFEEFFSIFDEFITLKTLEGLAERSIYDYKNNMQYFKEYLEEHQRTALVRCVEIDTFRGYLFYMSQEKEYKPCTINIRLRTIKSYLKWLHRERYLDEDISLRLKLVKEPLDTIKPLSDSDVKKILKIPDKTTFVGLRDFVIMVVMLDCGVRVGELVNLKIEDVDFRSRYINVPAEITKSRTFRQMPISSKTIELLKEMVSITKDSDTEYLFPSAYVNQLETNQVINSFSKYGKLAKIKAKCTCHVWRHTFAVNFIKGGSNVFTLQRILGHSTLDMTRRYIQLTNTDLLRKHKEVSPLNRFLK